MKINGILIIRLTLLLILVKHHIANILNISEILFLKKLDQFKYDFLFDPYKNKAIFHYRSRDVKVLCEILDVYFGEALERFFTLLIVELYVITISDRLCTVPWRVYEDCLNIISVWGQINFLNTTLWFYMVNFRQSVIYYFIFLVHNYLVFPWHNEVEYAHTIWDFSLFIWSNLLGFLHFF